MSKIAIVYWSGSGNTEEMAKAISEGAKAGGADVSLFEVEQFSVGDMSGYDAFLFGCPAMGDEVLEESVFDPFFTDAEKKLSGVNIGLFGSYGWGSGAWMEDWVSRSESAGAKVYNGAGLILENAPDDDGLEQCREFGKGFAGSL